MGLLQVVFIAYLSVLCYQKCAFGRIKEDRLPVAYDGEPFPINYTMTSCEDYIGEDVCCSELTNKLTMQNFKTIDGLFGTLHGGCDICAINLKRFWCQYACSPRQSQFVKVSQEYYEYPDPLKPGATILAQESNLTVQSSTACMLYNSCKRVSFVASLSAMNSPAGFISFQGKNAINDALQMINVLYTNDPTKGLYFGKLSNETQTSEFTSCEYKGQELHKFKVEQACDCNSCLQACTEDEGYHYTQPEILEGFDYQFVGIFYGVVVTIAIGITIYRKQKGKLSKNQ